MADDGNVGVIKARIGKLANADLGVAVARLTGTSAELRVKSRKPISGDAIVAVAGVRSRKHDTIEILPFHRRIFLGGEVVPNGDKIEMIDREHMIKNTLERAPRKPTVTASHSSGFAPEYVIERGRESGYDGGIQTLPRKLIP